MKKRKSIFLTITEIALTNGLIIAKFNEYFFIIISQMYVTQMTFPHY